MLAENDSGSLTTANHHTLSKTFTVNTFTVNTFASLLRTQCLLPSLLLSPYPLIGLTSSRVGSISDNSSGGSYAYSASKAALNSVGKSMAMNLKEKEVVVVLMHPGYVETGLDTSGKTHAMKEAVEPEEAAEKLWRVLMSKGIPDTGTFWHREGMELAW